VYEETLTGWPHDTSVQKLPMTTGGTWLLKNASIF